MHRIVVKNFGPLVDVDISLQKINFLLGEQASGKSTLAKLVYFFRTLPDEFASLILTSGADDWKSFRKSLVSLQRKKFTGMFGETKDLGDFHIEYEFTTGVGITIKPTEENNYLDVVFGSELMPKMAQIWDWTRNSSSRNVSNPYNIYLDIGSDVFGQVQDLFTNNFFHVYIPAGRALLSHQTLLRLILSDEIKGAGPDETISRYDVIDAPTRNYISEVDRVRDWYLRPQIKTSPDEENAANDSEYLLSLSQEILKGSYIPDKHSDYLEIPGNGRVRLAYASSGQQEVLWILNLLNAYAIQKRKCFVIIEEPEAHLHPEAQYMLAKEIAAFTNGTDSQIIITTHSPYILSSFNNLIFAGKIGADLDHNNNLEEIIPSKSWLNPTEFFSYVLEKGTVKSIKDDDLSMIDIAELDAIASQQDSEYEKMLSLRSGQDRCSAD